LKKKLFQGKLPKNTQNMFTTILSTLTNFTITPTIPMLNRRNRNTEANPSSFDPPKAQSLVRTLSKRLLNPSVYEHHFLESLELE
jgi:hypothetical protein